MVGYPILAKLISNMNEFSSVDLCCGAGEFANTLLDWGASTVTGVDISSGLLEYASEALPHMATLSDNGTLVSFNYLETHDSLISNSFIGMAQEYQTSRDLEQVLTDYSDQLDEIATHLLAIADAWQAAGSALEGGLTTEALMVGLTVGVVVGGVPIVGISIIRKRRVN